MAWEGFGLRHDHLQFRGRLCKLLRPDDGVGGSATGSRLFDPCDALSRHGGDLLLSGLEEHRAMRCDTGAVLRYPTTALSLPFRDIATAINVGNVYVLSSAVVN